MRFKVDENLPVEVAALFRDAGHEADTVHDEGLSSADDDRVAATCLAEDRVLITLDTDFANILRHPPGQTPGVIVLRLAQQDKPRMLVVVSTLLPLLAHEALRGRLWVVDERRVRVHGE